MRRLDFNASEILADNGLQGDKQLNNKTIPEEGGSRRCRLTGSG
jgi:hypothetical protein